MAAQPKQTLAEPLPGLSEVCSSTLVLVTFAASKSQIIFYDRVSQESASRRRTAKNRASHKRRKRNRAARKRGRAKDSAEFDVTIQEFTDSEVCSLSVLAASVSLSHPPHPSVARQRSSVHR
jgi:hypothetical protein